jgi:hypothetical protein
MTPTKTTRVFTTKRASEVEEREAILGGLRQKTPPNPIEFTIDKTTT